MDSRGVLEAKIHALDVDVGHLAFASDVLRLARTCLHLHLQPNTPEKLDCTLSRPRYPLEVISLS